MFSSKSEVKFSTILLIVLITYVDSFSTDSYDTSISSGRNVLFVDSRLDFDIVKFTPRLACSIESAARKNPERNVILFFASSKRFKALKITPLVDAVLLYSNVFFDSVNLTKLSLGTPLEDIMRSNKIKKSRFPIEHLADAIRLLLLWKYGGTYIDTDVIVRRSFDTVPSNFICSEYKGFPNGVMGFNHNEDGMEIVKLLMEEFASTYDPKGWAANGPHVITRVVKRLCGSDVISDIVKMKICKGFSFLKREECYAVRWMEWKDLMTDDPRLTEKVMNKFNESLTVHFYNHLSKNHILKTRSNAPYIQLARKYCPEVFKASGAYF